MKPEREFLPAYLPLIDVAKRLGFSHDWLKTHLPRLWAEGFPQPDALTGRYLAADVETWLENRRTIKPRAEAEPAPQHQEEIHYDAL